MQRNQKFLGLKVIYCCRVLKGGGVQGGGGNWGTLKIPREDWGIIYWDFPSGPCLEDHPKYRK